MSRSSRSVLALLIVAGVACSSGDTEPSAASATPEVSITSSGSPSTPSPALASPAFTKACTKAKAIDLTQDDPYILVIHDFEFIPNCLIVRQSAAIAIENLDDVGHTFQIDGTVVNAPLIVHRTYTHSADLDTFQPGESYPFHCSIHPQITGTLLVV
jgi:ABC-type transport system substrate-binding protein